MNSQNRKKQRIRKIVSLVLSYLLSLVMLAIFIVIGIFAGVFNDDVILERLNRSNYYANIYRTISNNVDSIILPTGLDSSVLDGVITERMVYIGAKKTIEGAIKGETVSIDTIQIKNRLQENILEYVEENNIAFSKEQQEGMEILSAEVSKEYIRMMNFSFIKYYTSYKAQFLTTAKFMIILLLVFAAMIIVAILALYRYKHQGIRYIAYSVLAASLMVSIVPVIILVSENYRKLNVTPKYFYEFMVSYLQWDITVFTYIGGIGAIVFAGLLLLIRFMKQAV